jgi:hypothetical protein
MIERYMEMVVVFFMANLDVSIVKGQVPSKEASSRWPTSADRQNLEAIHLKPGYKGRMKKALIESTS